MSPAAAPRTVESISQPAWRIVTSLANTMLRLGWQQSLQPTSHHGKPADDGRIFLPLLVGQEPEKTEDSKNATGPQQVPGDIIDLHATNIPAAMPRNKPHSGPTKLIVAFDVGTIYSGISYCIHEPEKRPEIFGVTRFPPHKLVGGDAMVPSLLYYDRSGNVTAAGFEALTESTTEAALTEGWMKAERWKLHLFPKHLASFVGLDNDLPPLPSGKSAVDVLADFIKYLFQCAKTYIQENHPALEWSTVEDSIEYIFTHPNGVQQQPYRQAIYGAGLIPSTPEGRSRVHMLTEGEASVHYCLARHFSVKSVNQATSPQGVVVIDAGGGTVDLNMFSTTLNPMSCEEIAPPECQLQGSVFVTRRAKTLLRRKLEGWEHSNDTAISEITHEFDRSAKLVIKNNQESIYVTVAGRRYNNSKYSISFGKLKLSGEEASGLMDDSVDAIIQAFERQEKFATTPITMVFLIGGFSSNDWLSSRLQSYFKAKNIHINRPNSHVNKAVANGAVSCYMYRTNYPVASRDAHAALGVLSDVAGSFVSQLRKSVLFMKTMIFENLSCSPDVL